MLHLKTAILQWSLDWLLPPPKTLRDPKQCNDLALLVLLATTLEFFQRLHVLLEERCQLGSDYSTHLVLLLPCS